MAATSYIAETLGRRTNRGFFARLRGGDEISYLVTLASTVSILLIVGLIVFELWANSRPTFKAFGFGFLTSSAWDPNADKYGALPFIYGTCVTSFVGMLIAVPLGLAASIFLAEMAPPKLSNFLVQRGRRLRCGRRSGVNSPKSKRPCCIFRFW